jgi:hypothetical protein
MSQISHRVASNFPDEASLLPSRNSLSLFYSLVWQDFSGGKDISTIGSFPWEFGVAPSRKIPGSGVETIVFPNRNASNATKSFSQRGRILAGARSMEFPNVLFAIPKWPNLVQPQN